MGYLVIHGDSYTRKVSLTNTCNKPRIAIKNNNNISYIPVSANKNGNKNIKVSNSYVDIRISSKVNTTTNTTSASNYQTYRQVNYNTTIYGNTYTTSVIGTTTRTVGDEWQVDKYQAYARCYTTVIYYPCRNYQNPNSIYNTFISVNLTGYHNGQWESSYTTNNGGLYSVLTQNNNITQTYATTYTVYIYGEHTGTTIQGNTTYTRIYTFINSVDYVYYRITGNQYGTAWNNTKSTASRYSYAEYYTAQYTYKSTITPVLNTTSASNSYYNTTSQVNTTTNTTSVSYY